MPGEEQQQGIADDHILGQAPLGAVVVDHRRVHARAGLLGVLVKQVGQELPDAGHRIGDALRPALLLRVVRLRPEIDPVQGGLDPVVEKRYGFQRYAQDLADHGRGQREGELVDEVDPGLALHLVQQLGGEAADLGLEVSDHVGALGRAEVPRHPAAIHVVLGRVHSDDRSLEGIVGLVRLGAFPRIRGDAQVVQQLDDLPIGADDVRAVRLARHRGLAQLFVEGVRIGAVGVAERLLPGRFLGHDGVLLPGCAGRWVASSRGVLQRRGRNTALRSLGSWPVRTTSGIAVGTPSSGNWAGIGLVSSGRSQPGGGGGNGPDSSISCP